MNWNEFMVTHRSCRRHRHATLNQVARPILRDLIVAVLASFAFIYLALTALSDGVPAFDVHVRDAVHSAATPFLTFFFRSITRLGSGWFLWAVGAVIVFGLARQNRDREA